MKFSVTAEGTIVRPVIPANMLTELTQTDLEKLEALRLERFRSYFVKPLQLATLFIDQSNKLLVICHSQADADEILAEVELLESISYFVVGASEVALYRVGLEQPIWGTSLQAWSFELESNETHFDFEESDMTTAVLEKPETIQSYDYQQPPQSDWLPIETVAKLIGRFTGQSQEAVINQILATRPEIRYQNGSYTLPVDFDFGAMQNGNGAAKPETNGAAKTATKPAAKKTTTAAKKTTAKKTATRKPAAKKSDESNSEN